MKKLRQLKNKGAVLMLNIHNIKTKSETLGDVELKYVSYDDIIEFAKILQEASKDRDFVARYCFINLLSRKSALSIFRKYQM